MLKLEIIPDDGGPVDSDHVSIIANIPNEELRSPATAFLLRRCRRPASVRVIDDATKKD